MTKKNNDTSKTTTTPNDKDTVDTIFNQLNMKTSKSHVTYSRSYSDKEFLFFYALPKEDPEIPKPEKNEKNVKPNKKNSKGKKNKK